MFDQLHLHARPRTENVYHNTKVVEERAPTDDSIKLYEEIKEKAFDSIIESIKIQDNLFNAKALLVKDPMTFGMKFYYTFRINGEEFKGSDDVDDMNRSDMIERLYDKLSKALARELIERSLSNKESYNHFR